MGMVVQHNMQAMNANRQLGTTSGLQAKSAEKLSSGYKINRAGDDAADRNCDYGACPADHCRRYQIHFKGFFGGQSR